MLKSFTLLLASVLCSQLLLSQGEPFSMTELNRKPTVAANKYRLGHPFEIIYGPDDYLYVTEKVGRVLRVSTSTGMRQVILDHRAATYLTISRNGSGTATSVGQDGMMGMALHPQFGMGTGQDYIYIAYTYSPGNLRISRFSFVSVPVPLLNSEQVLLQGIPASNDHSSGRLIFGADNLLYYTCGDLGYNQFGNRCNEIRSQKLPTSIQVAAGNYGLYAGKTLRINTDGTIPASNPLFAGVRSHIYTIGHRNAQGLVTQKSPTNGLVFPTPAAGGILFNSEHGPRTDDEINVIESGMNYGWPYIAGYLDNVNYSYVIWATSPNCTFTGYNENAIPAGAMVRQETDTVLTNFQPPLSTLYTVCNPLPVAVCNAGGTDWMKYPTIAPSSIDFYHVNSGTGIPGWYPSLLVPTLRKGVLYRYKLNPSMNGFDTDSIPYFKTSNRYRDIAVSPNGQKIYLITDSTGTTSGPSGTGTSLLANPGAILEFSYSGVTLPLGDRPPGANTVRKYEVDIFPNPASQYLKVQVAAGTFTRPMHYYLLDMTGKVVVRGSSLQKDFTIDINSWQTGVYILKVSNGYGVEVASEKIIIRR
jgi:PQQ-dependent dehydrogenase (s-GDH family)